MTVFDMARVILITLGYLAITLAVPFVVGTTMILLVSNFKEENK